LFLGYVSGVKTISYFFGMLSVVVMGLSSCQGYNSYDYLDGKFITKDLAPIDLLAPADKSTSGSKTPKFTWSKRSGATNYVLEISTKSDFSVLILRKGTADLDYTLAESDLIGISALDSLGYYWRVTAVYASQRVVSSSFVFHVISDAVFYVNANSTASEQVGNKSAPFKKIQSGIEAADTKRNGVASSAMNVYVAGGTYVEEISLKPGISVLGGYSGVDWSRNIANNLTTIQAPADTAVRGSILITTAYTATTIVDGFTILAISDGSNYVCHLADASPTISNNTIRSSNGGGGSYGIFAIATSPGSTANPTITANSIQISDSLNSAYGIYAGGGLLSSSATIRNNTIVVYSGLANSHSIYVTSSPAILNNTMGFSSGLGNSYGIYITSSASPNIRNNIIFGTGPGTCIYENSAGSDPAAVQNNNLFGCSTALYRDHDTSMNVTNLFLTGITNPSGTLGSMGNVTIDNAVNQLFLNQNGPDGNIYTMADNDWRLTTNPAICNVRGGGLNLSGSFTVDRDGLTRTISAIAGCTPSNTGATNWSMGAYESN